MKTFPMGDTLLIAAVPDRMSNAEARRYSSKSKSGFRNATATAMPPRPERGAAPSFTSRRT
jgi:hypothetical protein